MAQKTNSLAHTKWMCKYHIVFTPKYRRKVIYNQLRNDIREIIIRLCQYRGAFDVRSCTHVGNDTTKVKCIIIYGVFER
ncbi:hypothetical protein ERAC_01040 [Thomasclavelia ramosa]|nr:hypothetical protein ERAC_01040 [Thomasclavelia ramosa]